MDFRPDLSGLILILKSLSARLRRDIIRIKSATFAFIRVLFLIKKYKFHYSNSSITISGSESSKSLTD